MWLYVLYVLIYNMHDIYGMFMCVNMDEINDNAENK